MTREFHIVTPRKVRILALEALYMECAIKLLERNSLRLSGMLTSSANEYGTFLLVFLPEPWCPGFTGP